jgi:hypothetical protein
MFSLAAHLASRPTPPREPRSFAVRALYSASAACAAAALACALLWPF